ncbi:MAG: hypothetical protein WDN50_02435 [Bradyrhizobium sp.]
MLFGRFLNFSTTVEKTNSLPSTLTERRFRHFWEQTDRDSNERSRFGQVLRLMTEQAESFDPVSFAAPGFLCRRRRSLF